MNHSDCWRKIQLFIEERSNFIITTHVSPDGDALGSEIALSLMLTKLGKRCTIINSSTTSKNYHFLDPAHTIGIYKASEHLELLTSADGVFILDISDWKRLRDIGKAVRDLNIPRVCIDHHQPTDVMAEYEVIDPGASCTGELLYDFFAYLGEPLSAKIAEALYTCLLTDTGSFRFSNTTPRVHSITAELLKLGADARTVYEHVYETWSHAKIRLLADVLSSLKYECDGRLAWFVISQRLLEETGAKSWELDTFPEIPKMIENVQAGLLFTEIGRNRTKISLRSKGHIPIIAIAEKFGGGGHMYAAGAVIERALEPVIDDVLAEAKRYFEGQFAADTAAK